MKKTFIKPQTRLIAMPTESILTGSTPNTLSKGKTKSLGGSLTYSPNIGE